MRDVQRFTKTAGGLASRELPEGGSQTVLGDDTPEWVQLPQNLGGGQARVVAAYEGPCVQPGCGPHKTLVTNVDAPQDGLVAVIECSTEGRFWWVRVDRPDPKM